MPIWGTQGAQGIQGPTGPTGPAGATGTNLVTSVATRIGDVVLVKADVGLTNVDNTSDTNKPVSTAQAAADTVAKARANHTGTQVSTTISDFNAAVDARITVAPLGATSADVVMAVMGAY